MDAVFDFSDKLVVFTADTESMAMPVKAANLFKAGIVFFILCLHLQSKIVFILILL